ncbi:tautomerase family protein [Arthrobacter sp. H5]|uniref:tautomerase family protein n=1 Tax=Arthrobacter sp. H5 TaxID=1267973 RepID=UPI0004AD961B|nr:tautomerase family protein [Arthrobacter sp. H5]
MPLVRIDVNAGRSSEELLIIIDGIHQAILAEYRIPQRDRAQYVTWELGTPR